MLASLVLAEITRRNTFFPETGRSSATIDLAVARTFQPVSIFTKHTGVIVVSSGA